MRGKKNAVCYLRENRRASGKKPVATIPSSFVRINSSECAWIESKAWAWIWIQKREESQTKNMNFKLYFFFSFLSILTVHTAGMCVWLKCWILEH